MSDRIMTICCAIAKRNYRSYLELGCYKNDTFNIIGCSRKVGVDIEQGGTHRMTTDEFFGQNTEKFDIIFIDATHTHDQVMKDFQSSLRVLNPGGLIVMHDCNPANASLERPEACGTAWRAFVRLRAYPTLDAIVGNYDHGVGLIHVAPNTDIVNVPMTMDELTYDDLEKNRDPWLRLREWRKVEAWL